MYCLNKMIDYSYFKAMNLKGHKLPEVAAKLNNDT